MLEPRDYFEKYLTLQVDTINATQLYYQSYSSMDRRYLEFLADSANSPAAAEELGARLLFDAHNTEEAIRWLTRAAELGAPEAPLLLANLTDDPARAQALTQQSADRGCCAAMLVLRKSAQGSRALALAEQCAARAMDILELFFTLPVSNDCDGMIRQYISLSIQAVCAAAEQYLTGSGIPADKAAARTLLTDAQAFFVRMLEQPVPDFTALLELTGSAEDM